MQMEHICLTNAHRVFTLSFNMFTLISFTTRIRFESLVELETISQENETIFRQK